MNLQQYCFPVEERAVSFASDSKFYDWKTKSYLLKQSDKHTDQYKAIVRSDNNSLISIVTKNYQLVPNKELIELNIGYFKCS